MEVGDLLRRVGSIATAIPRQLSHIADLGSIENARGEIQVARSQRRIEEALEGVVGLEEPPEPARKVD